jgi:hypothetical protein
MTNETIDKIARMNCGDFRDGVCDIDGCKCNFNCESFEKAEAIYKQIVEPLEGKIEGYKNWINCKGNDLNYFMNESEELQHKVKVLERALELACAGDNYDGITEEEWKSIFIEQATKELKENETE